MDFELVLNDVRESLGEAPRKLSRRHRIDMPTWVFSDFDKLGLIAWHQGFLLKKGQVVWGALVQANSIMFRPGTFNCPGNMIYSLDSAMSAKPEILLEAAVGLYSTKGEQTGDKEFQRFSDNLADEMKRLMKLAVPNVLTQGINSYFTSVMFERRHLPKGIIANGLMPMLVHPNISATMIVPSWHWPKNFIEQHWQTDWQFL